MRGWENLGFERKNQDSRARISKNESDLVVLTFSVPGPVRMQFLDPEYIHFMQVNVGSHNFGAVGRSMVHESKIRNKFVLCR